MQESELVTMNEESEVEKEDTNQSSEVEKEHYSHSCSSLSLPTILHPLLKVALQMSLSEEDSQPSIVPYLYEPDWESCSESGLGTSSDDESQCEERLLRMDHWMADWINDEFNTHITSTRIKVPDRPCTIRGKEKPFSGLQREGGVARRR